MGEGPLGTSAAERPVGDQLDSWKEIASYLKRDVTTVQRWEKREGMPVHRHLHDRLGSIYASRAELDAWTRSRNRTSSSNENGIAPPTALPVEQLTVEQPTKSAASPNSGNRLWRGFFVWLAALAVVVLATAIWLWKTERFWRSPIADARFQAITDFDGAAAGAALSRDGHLVAFLSDRDGPMDVWVTQVGSGEYHNLTHGSIPGLEN